MKNILIALIICPALAFGQSKVMRNLAEEFPEARVIMLYHSTLNMLNIEEDEEYARMIRDIEKIKLLIVDKTTQKYSTTVIDDLKSDLSKYDFEELMTLRSKDYDIGVYINDDDGDIEGFFFIMDEEESLVAVDLVGNMPVGDVGKLIDKIKEANDL